MAVFFAVPAGVFASRLGLKRAVVSGLLVLSAASFVGSFARSESELLIARIGEGLGYLAVIVSAPSLIAQIANKKDHLVALGGWGAFLPAGVALGTVLGPYAMRNDGWRGLWLWSAACLFIFAIVVGFSLSTSREIDRSGKVGSLQSSFEVYGNPAMVALAGIFGCYTFEHLGIMSLFPSYLIRILKASPVEAGLLNSVAMALNILGNVAAGFLLRRGARLSIIIPATLISMMLSAFLIFESQSITLAFVGACAFCSVGGAVPGAVLAVLPSYVRSYRELAPGNGLLVQGSNVGILLGPVALSSVVSSAGWSWSPIVCLISLLGGSTLLFFVLRASERQI